MIFAEVLPLEIFASRHLRSSLLSFTTNLLFAMILPLVGSTRHGKNQCSRKIATPLFSWCNPLGHAALLGLLRPPYRLRPPRTLVLCGPPMAWAISSNFFCMNATRASSFGRRQSYVILGAGRPQVSRTS